MTFIIAAGNFHFLAFRRSGRRSRSSWPESRWYPRGELVFLRTWATWCQGGTRHVDALEGLPIAVQLSSLTSDDRQSLRGLLDENNRPSCIPKSWVWTSYTAGRKSTLVKRKLLPSTNNARLRSASRHPLNSPVSCPSGPSWCLVRIGCNCSPDILWRHSRFYAYISAHVQEMVILKKRKEKGIITYTSVCTICRVKTFSQPNLEQLRMMYFIYVKIVIQSRVGWSRTQTPTETVTCRKTSGYGFDSI